jgi:solute carrier family 25 phosphate transporter 3
MVLAINESWIDRFGAAQTDPSKYRSISSGFGVLFREQGLRGFFRGWAPTLLGYSAQGACKYGLYEYFKKHYSDALLPLGAHESSDHHPHHHPQQQHQQLQKTVIYLASAASAEVVADVALCPFEAVKVRVQTQPGFARGLFDGFPKLVASQGYAG